MESYEFVAGQWSEIEDPLGWEDGEDQPSVLKRNGYSEHSNHTFGTEHGFQVELFTASGTGIDKKPYLIQIGTTFGTCTVVIKAFADVVELLSKLTPICQAEICTINYDDKELEILRKEKAKFK